MEAEVKEKQEILLFVKTPLGNLEREFQKTAKVQDVIQAVISKFGFAQNGHYELRPETNPDELLKPERTLVSYKLKDKDILIFTDLGVGV